jgi:hypothetical protein
MNDRYDEFDAGLTQAFRREHTHLPAEPFSSATLRAIGAEGTRAARRAWLVRGAALAALLVAFPRLVDASVWISARLDELLTSASAWLASPLGLTVAALGVVAALATKWARVW